MELQFAFLCFLVAQNYDSFEHWKQLVVSGGVWCVVDGVQGSDMSCNPAKSWNGHFPSY